MFFYFRLKNKKPLQAARVFIIRLFNYYFKILAIFLLTICFNLLVSSEIGFLFL